MRPGLGVFVDTIGIIAIIWALGLIPIGLLGALIFRSRRRGLLRIAGAGLALGIGGFVLFVQFNPKMMADRAAATAQAHVAAQAAAAQAEIDAQTQKSLELEQAASAQADAAEQNRRGFHCLSAWDGSVRNFKVAVQALMREPDSFEHIQTRITPVNDAGFHIAFMDYRSRNGFGGMNVSTATASVRNSDCSFTILTVE